MVTKKGFLQDIPKRTGSLDVLGYGTIINSISTLMYMVRHVDKYKITFKLVIHHWTNKIL
jgi:hypothetical protein